MTEVTTRVPARPHGDARLASAAGHLMSAVAEVRAAAADTGATLLLTGWPVNEIAAVDHARAAIEDAADQAMAATEATVAARGQLAQAWSDYRDCAAHLPVPHLVTTDATHMDSIVGMIAKNGLVETDRFLRSIGLGPREPAWPHCQLDVHLGADGRDKAVWMPYLMPTLSHDDPVPAIGPRLMTPGYEAESWRLRIDNYTGTVHIDSSVRLVWPASANTEAVTELAAAVRTLGTGPAELTTLAIELGINPPDQSVGWAIWLAPHPQHADACIVAWYRPQRYQEVARLVQAAARYCPHADTMTIHAGHDDDALWIQLPSRERFDRDTRPSATCTHTARTHTITIEGHAND